MSYSNILVALRLHRKVSNCWQSGIYRRASKGHQFNYSLPTRVTNQGCADGEDLRGMMQEETQGFLDS